MEAKRPIELTKVVVETTASEITKQVGAPLLPLLLALVVALVPQVRDRVLPALSKPLLAVTAGIALSLNLAFLFYTLRLWGRLKRARAEVAQTQDEKVKLQDLIDNPPFRTEFGVRWSKELIPYCPACSSPLNYTHNALAAGVGSWGFRCVKCSAFIALNDQNGRNIELSEAKRLLSSKDLATESRAVNTASFDKTKLRQAHSDLESIKQNLQNSDVEEKIVILYNGILDRLKNETGYDLTGFSIPQSEIDYHKTHYPRSPGIGRAIRSVPAHTVYSDVRYCDRQRFRTAIDSAINRLKIEI